jgi:hypothetical protein
VHVLPQFLAIKELNQEDPCVPKKGGMTIVPDEKMN